MPHHDLWRPLGVIAAGLALTFVLLARTEGSPRVQQAPDAYPAQTQTALAQRGDQTAYPIGGASPTAGTTLPVSATATLTPTATTAATAATVATAAATAAPTVAVPAITPTATTEPTATPGLEGSVPCVPGVELRIAGSGPPRAPILIYFGDRVVGGGSVQPDGTFALPLLVGIEREGEHLVTVRVRGGDEVLTQFTCVVAAVTPTPLPKSRPLP